MYTTTLTPEQTLQGLRELGFTVRNVDDKIILDGQLGLLDERRRAIIRLHKPAILELLRRTNEADAEREAIQWADTPNASKYLDHALQLFGPCEVHFLDTPEKIAQHEEGLITGVDEVDAWLSQCDHHPRHGTWHWLDGDQCCRFCCGFYETIIAREARENDVHNNKYD